MNKVQNVCAICLKTYTGFGHNLDPVETVFGGRCCDSCNATIVIPTRLNVLLSKASQKRRKQEAEK